MSDLEPKDPGEKCNARKTDGSGHCKQPAGFGTDHVGHGRCKYHGGNTENQEKAIIEELEDAAADGATAVKLQLKQMRQKLEDGEEVDVGDLNKLARTVFDRTGNGPTEKHEHTGERGGPVEVEVNETVVETGYDE